MKAGYSLGRDERLRTHSAFDLVRRKSRALKGEWLVANVYPNSLDFNRIGVSISARAVQKSAKRHRARRLIREAYRLNKQGFKRGFDIVIRTKPGDSVPNLKEVETDLLALFKRAGILL